MKNDATKLLVPGAYWESYHVEVGKMMTSALIDLKLLGEMFQKQMESVRGQSVDLAIITKNLSGTQYALLIKHMPCMTL